MHRKIFNVSFGLFFCGISIPLALNQLDFDSPLLKELAELNFWEFFKTFSLIVFCSLIFFLGILMFTMILVDSEKDYSSAIVNIWILTGKFLVIFDVILAMLLHFNADQFTLATTVISFIALFSFVFPKKEFRKLIENFSRFTKK